MRVLNVVLIVLIAAFIIPVAWEYMSIRFGITTGFKLYGALIIETVRKIFRLLGVSLARIVSILEWIGFRYVLQAIDTTIDFYVELITSWWWMFVGFFTYIQQFDAATFYLNVGNILAQAGFWMVFKHYWNRRYEGSLTFRKSEWMFIASIVWFISVILVNFVYVMFTSGKMSHAWINVTPWYQ